MITATIGIGLPGSGKTTVLKIRAERSGAIYIAPDEVRAELAGDASIQSLNTAVWIETYRRISAALEAGQSVVVDATNAKQPDRARLAALCRPADRVDGIWFDPPFELCQERNAKRQRVVPDHSMRRMKKELEKTPPCLADGFDRIIHYLD